MGRQVAHGLRGQDPDAADGLAVVDRVTVHERGDVGTAKVVKIVNNMVVGVTEGFRKELDIVGVGYRAAVQGAGKLDLSLGFSHPVVVEAPEGIEFVVPQPTRIEVHGIDKQLVGQVAANIRSLRKPEPYTVSYTHLTLPTKA